jgi:hypothetical protein
MAQASSYPSKTTPIAADTVLLIDSAASNAVKQARVDAIAGVATNGVQVPRSSGSAVFAVDSSATGSTLTIANGATATPFGNANNFSGLVIIKDTVAGWMALFLLGGGGQGLISDPSSQYANSDTASKLCCYYSGNVVAIKNNIGSQRILSITGIRIAAAN